jgi:hypothetical protein
MAWIIVPSVGWEVTGIIIGFLLLLLCICGIWKECRKCRYRKEREKELRALGLDETEIEARLEIEEKLAEEEEED